MSHILKLKPTVFLCVYFVHVTNFVIITFVFLCVYFLHVKYFVIICTVFLFVYFINVTYFEMACGLAAATCLSMYLIVSVLSRVYMLLLWVQVYFWTDNGPVIIYYVGGWLNILDVVLET